jgi:hypothetical protein
MMTQTDVARIRQAFANRIAALAQIKSSALVEPLANVPREDFVGRPGRGKSCALPLRADTSRRLIPIQGTCMTPWW